MPEPDSARPGGRQIPSWARRVHNHKQTPRCARCKSDHGPKVPVVLTGTIVDGEVPLEHPDRVLRYEGETHLCIACFAQEVARHA